MKIINTLLLFVLLSPPVSVFADDVGAMEDARIRKVVEEMLRAKDKKITDLDERVKELEQLAKSQKKVIEQLQEEKAQAGVGGKTNPANSPSLAQTPAETKEVGGAPQAEAQAKESSSIAKLILPTQKKEDVKTPDENEDKGPKVSGFFDATAQTKNNSNQPFHVGVVELDLESILHEEYFAASAALDWFPYGTSPNAQIGAAFLDFHLYDHNIPVRGRIFEEPGFHVQVGQFDLPFSSDYQFFASRDRPTITPPMTTTRIQQSGINPSNGGFNSTGIRTYGKWNHLNYAAYGTDSVYSNGTAVGGRVGFSLDDPYRLHKRSELPLLDAGLSTLVDMDKTEHTTDKVYAADLSFHYGSYRLLSEWMLHDANKNRTDGNAALNEYAYHVTMIADLEEWLKHSLYVYGRYQEWNPNFDFLVADDTAFRVERIPAVTLGLGYRLNEYVLFKVEYTDTLGHQTAEPDFQKRIGIAQLVGSF